MNQELKKVHFLDIGDPKARDAYELLCRACETREGGMTDAQQMLIGDYARAEQIKQKLIADIEERGIGQKAHNGRQTYWQKNDSVAQLRSYSEQQRKLLNELRLTPSSEKANAVPIDDGFDAM